MAPPRAAPEGRPREVGVDEAGLGADADARHEGRPGAARARRRGAGPVGTRRYGVAVGRGQAHGLDVGEVVGGHRAGGKHVGPHEQVPREGHAEGLGRGLVDGEAQRRYRGLPGRRLEPAQPIGEGERRSPREALALGRARGGEGAGAGEAGVGREGDRTGRAHLTQQGRVGERGGGGEVGHRHRLRRLDGEARRRGHAEPGAPRRSDLPGGGRRRARQPRRRRGVDDDPHLGVAGQPEGRQQRVDVARDHRGRRQGTVARRPQPRIEERDAHGRVGAPREVDRGVGRLGLAEEHAQRAVGPEVCGAGGGNRQEALAGGEQPRELVADGNREVGREFGPIDHECHGLTRRRGGLGAEEREARREGQEDRQQRHETLRAADEAGVASGTPGGAEGVSLGGGGHGRWGRVDGGGGRIALAHEASSAR